MIRKVLGLFNEHVWFSHSGRMQKVLASIYNLYNRIIILFLGNIRVVTRDGIKYELDLNELIDRSIFHFSYYEPDTTKYIKQYCRKNMVVLDVGANIGAHALRISKIVGPKGKVIAFEPMKYAFDKLSHNVSLNGMHNLKLEKCALSDKNTKKKIHFRTSWLSNSQEKPQSTHTESIQFERLDSYLARNEIKKVDFVKIDVDGYEYKVLLGAKKTLHRHHPILVTEIGNYKSGNYKLADFLHLLNSLGYNHVLELDSNTKLHIKELVKKIPFDNTKNVMFIA